MVDMLKDNNNDVVLVFLLLILNAVDFEHLNTHWVREPVWKYLSKNLYHIKISPSFYIMLFSWEFCEIFKNTFFTEHLWTTAFVPGENYIIIYVNAWIWL